MLDELTWEPAWKIRERIAAKDVSPVEVLDHFLDRIDALDPTLKAFKHIDADGARAQAKDAEAAVARGDELGPLHGIPMSFKEHIAVEGMPLMGMFREDGSPKLARADDLGVARLRAAGAIVVGTNTMMGTSAPAPGQYAWDKEARNPWDPTRAPGWSSSGGAATSAARLLPIAIGSDGGGSTRLPGAYSGVVAVHPSAGLIPSYNPSVKARRNPTGTIGPMTRDVRDAAITLQAMAGPDGRDFDCIQAPAHDMLAHLDDGVDGMRLAWTDDYGFASMYAFDESARVIGAIRNATRPTVEGLGAKLDTTDESWDDFWTGYVSTNFLFGGGPTGTVQAPPREEWVAAIETRGHNWTKFRDLFAEYDLLLSPTSQLLAPTIEDWAARWGNQAPEAANYPHGTFAPHYTSHTHMFNWLGFPAVNVPCGFVDGLPIGLQVVAWPGNDDVILRFAQAFLQAAPREEHPPVS